MLRVPWLLSASSTSFTLPFVSRSRYPTLSTLFCDLASSFYYLRSNFKTVEIVFSFNHNGEINATCFNGLWLFNENYWHNWILIFKLEFLELSITCLTDKSVLHVLALGKQGMFYHQNICFDKHMVIHKVIHQFFDIQNLQRIMWLSAIKNISARL